MYIFIFMFALRDPNWKCRRFIRFSLPGSISLLHPHSLWQFFLFYFRVFLCAAHNLIHVCVRGRNILQMFTIRYAHLLSFASRLLWFDYFRLDSRALVRLTLRHITSTKCKFFNKHIYTIFMCKAHMCERSYVWAFIYVWLNGFGNHWKMENQFLHRYAYIHTRTQTSSTEKKNWLSNWSNIFRSKAHQKCRYKNNSRM